MNLLVLAFRSLCVSVTVTAMDGGGGGGVNVVGGMVNAKEHL
jgi:hypothetical protein